MLLNGEKAFAWIIIFSMNFALPDLRGKIVEMFETGQ